MQIHVGNKRIGENNPVFIVAEIGINHNGCASLAFRLVKEAKKAGVDAVKIQLVNPSESYAKESSSYSIFLKNQLNFKTISDLKRESEKRGLIFFATPGDITSLECLLKLKVKIIKISSGNLTNYPLLREVGKTGLPVIVSTGMAYLNEINESVKILEREGTRKIIILHCVSGYPAKPHELNLNVMRRLVDLFKYPIGYSDHCVGNLAAFASVAMGAKLIEKHFTLDKKLKGPDHRFSADPHELTELVRGIRQIEQMSGSSFKKLSSSEVALRDTMRRFLVFAKSLKSGTILKKEYIGIKRLSGKKGLSPNYYSLIIGRKIKRDVAVDSPIKKNILF